MPIPGCVLVRIYIDRGRPRLVRTHTSAERADQVLGLDGPEEQFGCAQQDARNIVDLQLTDQERVAGSSRTPQVSTT